MYVMVDFYGASEAKRNRDHFVRRPYVFHALLLLAPDAFRGTLVYLHRCSRASRNAKHAEKFLATVRFEPATITPSDI